MDRSQLPLNALRAFEAAARHLSFTRAASELCVTQAALSHHIKLLEERLGFALFQRLPRGVVLTDEGAALAPSISDSLDQMSQSLGSFASGRKREVITVGVVSTFATGWLLPRLRGFTIAHPEVDIRIRTNNNVPELAGEGLDLAIRYGDGSWHGTEAQAVMPAPLTPMCAPSLRRSIRSPADLGGQTLLRSYRSDEWPTWFKHLGKEPPSLTGPVFDSSLAIAQSVMSGLGIGLLPSAMFHQELESERMVTLSDTTILLGQYWITKLQSREMTDGMAAFQHWLIREATRSSG